MTQSPPRFGIAVAPVTDASALRDLARAAELSGLDLLGLPDHPYSAKHLDALVVAADLLARTTRLHLFTDVANLPLRPATVLAKSAASLDVLSGGRFHLGLGAGQVWDSIAAVGGPVLAPADAREGLREAVSVARALWHGHGQQSVPGRQHALDGAWPGPRPSSALDVWVGAVLPKMLETAGEVGDAWAAPIPPYLPYDRWTSAHAHVDAGAMAAGRSPSDVRRIGQVVGAVVPSDDAGLPDSGSAPVLLTVDGWVDVTLRLLTEHRFDDVVYWPTRASTAQVEAFGEVVRRVRGMRAHVQPLTAAVTAS